MPSIRNGGVVENISSLIGPKIGVAASDDDEGRLVVVVEKNALQDDVDAASRMAEAPPKDFIMVAAVACSRDLPCCSSQHFLT